jgi:hypothetical protein
MRKIDAAPILRRTRFGLGRGSKFPSRDKIATDLLA